jgi:hypothetical protein
MMNYLIMLLLYVRNPGIIGTLITLAVFFVWSVFFEKEPDIPSAEEQEAQRGKGKTPAS